MHASGYAVEILSDAMQYAAHAEKPTIDIADVKMAIQARVNTSFTPAPSREVRSACLFFFLYQLFI